MQRLSLAQTLCATAIGVAGFAGQAAAQSAPPPAPPIGEWMVKEKIATIRIENCGGTLWGVIAWEKLAGTDVNNPDPAKRQRPTLGMPIILGMKPVEKNLWEGSIYNSKDGKTYSAKLSMEDPNSLRVEGCVLGFLCGGETWTRVRNEPKPPGQTQPTARDICARIADAGTTRR